MSDPKNYSFSWDDLGDSDSGRPNLGSTTSVTAYRLLAFTFKEVLCRDYGLEKTRQLFVRAGHLAGSQFCRNLLDTGLEFEAFIAQLKQVLIDQGIGVLRIEAADLQQLAFTLTVSEDLDCSGLSVYGDTVCDYDEGFLAGIMEEYTGKEFAAEEIDCWATGDRTCRFKVTARDADD